MTAPSLESLLAEHRPALERWLSRHARGLLPFESIEDLVQGAHMQAIENRARFEWRGEPAFRAWLTTIARQHVADRNAHWSAKKREAGYLLRVTADATQSRPGGVTPAARTRGPATRVEQGEQLSIAMQALALLLPRDQSFVQWFAEDLSLDEVAARLGLSKDAAERGRLRAVERFRRAYALVEKRGRA